MYSGFNCGYNHKSAFQSIFPSNLEAFLKHLKTKTCIHVQPHLCHPRKPAIFFSPECIPGQNSNSSFFWDNLSWWSHILSNKCKNQVAAPKDDEARDCKCSEAISPLPKSLKFMHHWPLYLWDKINFPCGHRNTAQYQGKETACHKKCCINPKKRLF